MGPTCNCCIVDFGNRFLNILNGIRLPSALVSVLYTTHLFWPLLDSTLVKLWTLYYENQCILPLLHQSSCLAHLACLHAGHVSFFHHVGSDVVVASTHILCFCFLHLLHFLPCIRHCRGGCPLSQYMQPFCFICSGHTKDLFQHSLFNYFKVCYFLSHYRKISAPFLFLPCMPIAIHTLVASSMPSNGPPLRILFTIPFSLSPLMNC